ncbi:MAG TPA: M13 family metallopeptidase [Flavobacteriaceae bacterium]|nr:M13 family metallopeptidase [Flavobacteriaceae bacterium]
MKINVKQTLLGALSVLAVTSCIDDKKDPKMENATGDTIPGINMAYLDTTVRPQDDFYQFVNGGWLKDAEIPADRTSWGGFQILRKKTDADVLEIIANAQESGKYAASTDQAKAIFVFESALDTMARNKTGIAPIQPALEKINSIQNVEDLQRVLAENPAEISSPFFGLAVFSDPDDSDINAAYIATGRLGLPDRSYYVKDDANSKKVREQYVAHITRMLQFLGTDEATAQKNAEMILAFETKLATPRFTKVESRDFRNFDNPKSIAELSQIVPAVEWNQYISGLGVEKELDTVIVMQPKYMKTLQDIFAEGNVEKWKTMMRWSTLNSAASQLTTEMEKANWDFYSKTLRGAKEQRPANERALATVNGTVGEALGKLYVDEKFPPEAKVKAEKMIDNIIAAYQTRIEALEWMSDSTKAKAIEKLDKFTVKIGYPDKWEDYSNLKVDADNSYYENMVAVSNWNYEEDLSEIGEPVDKTEWGMSPQTVNAYFNPFYNEIVFPAAILQPPFYDYEADAAVNYGGIGAVIGHEISHAFDDSGARFDAEGNLNNWWSEEDLENFTKRGDALAEFYSNIEVLDSVYINGKFTLGENIGDLGGVLAAYDGLMRYYEENGRPGKIEGFTPEQRFFMSWATVWRGLIRDEALQTKIKTDPHSPGQVRGYAPLLHVDAFYKAFDIQEGDSMYIEPEDRVRIW